MLINILLLSMSYFGVNDCRLPVLLFLINMD